MIIKINSFINNIKKAINVIDNKIKQVYRLQNV